MPSPCRSSPGITNEISNTCVGTASGETCIFECATTHYTVGSVTCDHGSFVLSTSPAAECKLIEQCGVPSVENGQYDPTGWVSAQNGTVLDASMISCNPGYQKIDPSPIAECVCPAESTDPCQTLTNRCSEISCGANIVTGGGVVSSANCPAQTGSAAYAINRPTCAFSCDDGFYIDAATNEKECNIDGTWPTGPACAEYICRGINVQKSREQAGASCDATGASSQPTCEYECQDGWEIVGGSGNRFASCDYFGVWSPAPTCQKSSCTPYEVPNSVGGLVNGVTDDIVEVACAQGYTGPASLGNNETGGSITCQPDGTFTTFTCEANACEPYQIPLSRDYDILTTGVQGTTGQSFEVHCKEPWSSGTFTTTCQPDGYFSEVTCEGIPQCAVILPEGTTYDPTDATMIDMQNGAVWQSVGENCTLPGNINDPSCGSVFYSSNSPEVKTCYTPSCGSSEGGYQSNCVLGDCVIDECPPDPEPTTQGPAAPTTTQAPAAPTTTQAPTAPTTTQAPVVPTTTQAPVAPTTTQAPAAPTTTQAPAAPTTTQAPVAPTTTQAPVAPTTTAAPEEVVATFDVTVNLGNMDDSYVTNNNAAILRTVSDGVCYFLDSTDPDASCEGVSLTAKTSSRRRLAEGEWVGVVKVTSSSNTARTASFNRVNDASLASEFLNTMVDTMTNSGHSDAISSGSSLTTSASASNSDDGDDDGSSNGNMLVIIAAAAGGTVFVIVLIAVVYLMRSSKNRGFDLNDRDRIQSSAVSETTSDWDNGDDVFRGPGPDDL